MNSSHLRRWLNAWGEWVDRAALKTGYPTQSTTGIYEIVRSHRAMQWPLPGGGSFRYALPSQHRILCAEMPDNLIPLHQAILALPDDHRGILTFWYAYSLTPDGTYWDRRDKAVFVCIPYEHLKQRVRTARTVLARKLLPKNVANPPLGMIASANLR